MSIESRVAQLGRAVTRLLGSSEQAVIVVAQPVYDEDGQGLFYVRRGPPELVGREWTDELAAELDSWPVPPLIVQIIRDPNLGLPDVVND